MPKTAPTDAAQLTDYCTLRYWQFDFALSAGRRPAAVEAAQALVSAAGPRCDGVRQRLVLSSKYRAEGDFGSAVAHLLVARRIDATDSNVAAILYDLIEQLSVAIENGKPPLWFNKLVPSGKSSELRDMLAQIAQAEITDIKPAKLLAKMAWKAWQSAEAVEKPTANKHLQLAATILEETDPASRLAVLLKRERRSRAENLRHLCLLIALLPNARKRPRSAPKLGANWQTLRRGSMRAMMRRKPPAIVSPIGRRKCRNWKRKCRGICPKRRKTCPANNVGLGTRSKGS